MTSLSQAREIVQMYAFLPTSDITKYRDMNISTYLDFALDDTEIIYT